MSKSTSNIVEFEPRAREGSAHRVDQSRSPAVAEPSR
jgi:hypothetical protein